MREFDLEDIYKSLRAIRKHADRAIVTGKAVIFVEETSRARIDDVYKLAETVKALKEDQELKNALKLGNTLSNLKVIVVLHSPHVDSMISKKLEHEMKKLYAIPLTAPCDRDLKNKLKSLGIL